MKSTRRQILAVAAALACGLGCGVAAHAAAAYPSKPITVIVSYPPGGDTDAIARLFADKLSQRLHQTVVVENKGGAGGTVGNGFVGRAAPDGYTLLFTPNPFTTAPMVLGLSVEQSYDVLHGFEPIIMTAEQPLVLVANPKTGFTSVQDMVGAAQAGKPVTYASPGAGSPMHIIAEWLNRAASVQIQHVPYRGVGPEVTDVVAGHVNTAWVTFGPVFQYIADGRLNALAIGDARRSPLAPDVPTLVESGYKEVITGAWNGFFAPKGTSPEIVKLLNEQLNAIVKDPEVVKKLAVYGAVPHGGRPEELGNANATDYRVVGGIIKSLGIKAQ